MSTDTIDISICICTFRRPALLGALLQALTEQTLGSLRVEVVVVDNDPAASAAPVLAQWQTRMPFALQACHAPTPNIAMARNMAVHQAQGEWILFIDDDETPDAGWITSLYAAQQTYQADAVFGPVLPRYNAQTPAWVKQGRFFDRRRLATGTPITTQDARTGNVIIRRSRLLAIPGPFDAAFGRTGAEDTMLFRTMLAQGAVLVWCDTATVSEDVPAERANIAWLLRRSYRLGQTYVLSEIVPLSGLQRWRRAIYLGGRALIQLAVATVLTLAYLPFSRLSALRWLRTASGQCGKLSALAGHRYYEYGH